MKIKHIKVHAFLAAGGKLDIGDALVGVNVEGYPNPFNGFTVISTPDTPTFPSEKFFSEHTNCVHIIKNETGEVIIPDCIDGYGFWYLLVDVGSSNRQKYFNKILKNRKQKAALEMLNRHPTFSYNKEIGEWG